MESPDGWSGWRWPVFVGFDIERIISFLVFVLKFIGLYFRDYIISFRNKSQPSIKPKNKTYQELRKFLDC